MLVASDMRRVNDKIEAVAQRVLRQADGDEHIAAAAMTSEARSDPALREALLEPILVDLCRIAVRRAMIVMATG